jgi:hypothetical protein
MPHQEQVVPAMVGQAIRLPLEFLHFLRQRQRGRAVVLLP